MIYSLQGCGLVQVLNINMPTGFGWIISCVLKITNTVTLHIFKVTSNIANKLSAEIPWGNGRKHIMLDKKYFQKNLYSQTWL